MTPLAAIRFRHRVYKADFHHEALTDLLDDPTHPEGREGLEILVDAELEPIEFGRWVAYPHPGRFVPFRYDDNSIRKEWYKPSVLRV